MKKFCLISLYIFCTFLTVPIAQAKDCLKFLEEQPDSFANGDAGCVYKWQHNNRLTYPLFSKVDSAEGCGFTNINLNGDYKSKRQCD
jgi:hypothetical protein